MYLIGPKMFSISWVASIIIIAKAQKMLFIVLSKFGVATNGSLFKQIFFKTTQNTF